MVTESNVWHIVLEIKLSIQSDFASGSRLMGIIRIHLMIYFLECSSIPESFLASIVAALVEVNFTGEPTSVAGDNMFWSC